MKLRIRGDSLRFRLTQGEVSQLLAGRKISESVHFSGADGNALTYSLETSERAVQPVAHFAGREIQVDLPLAMVEPWAKTDQVGIESAQPIGDGKHLRIIVEKDFRCLQPRADEDERDHFPHPESDGGSLRPQRAGPLEN